MAVQVNANRMELLRLKRRKQVALRGHKLLKDKLEGLLQRFMEIIDEYKGIRGEVDRQIRELFQHFALAQATMAEEAFRAALAFPECTATLEVQTNAIMNVRVPQFLFSIRGNLAAYGVDGTTRDLDRAMGKLQEVLQAMVRLAEIEKTIQLVAEEIEKTRRRVNALEYILIPQLDDAIRTISSKLEELDRGNITRLMKVKEMLGM
jgi:V/A-type H+-transporting ATPase subunit D